MKIKDFLIHFLYGALMAFWLFVIVWEIYSIGYVCGERAARREIAAERIEKAFRK